MDMRDLIGSFGAQFGAADGAIVTDFGDPDAEAKAARESAVVVDRSGRGKLAFTGADRASFLHGMLTNTVGKLGEGEGNHTALTDAKGNTQADFRLYNWGDRLMSEFEPGVHAAVSAFLSRYIIADDVEIEDVTEAFGLVGVQGPEAARIVEAVTATAVDGLALDGHTASDATGVARIVRRSYTGEDGFDLWVEPDAAADVFRGVIDAGATPAGETALERLRIEAGVPRYGVDVDDGVVPLEGGLADTVDFAKGCFIGQEVLAKMNNLGRPRRYLVGMLVEGEAVPAPGTELFADGKTVGLVKSGTRSPAVGRTICLASVRRDSETAGTVLADEDGREYEVVDLPFYIGKSLEALQLNLSA